MDDKKRILKSGYNFTEKQELNRYLCSLAESTFQKFSSSLIPNIPAGTVLGVRLPILRKIAREIARGAWEEYLLTASDDFFEEVMLQGMVIGYLNVSLEEKLRWVAWFVPKIDNWSVCDSFCTGLKIAKDNPQEVWEFIQGYLGDDREYFIRFGVVMLLFYYTGEEYCDQGLKLLEEIESEYYYVKMAVAWAVSIYYVNNQEKTMKFLKECRLDDFTYNKALQKITESQKVDRETKTLIRAMKRRG